MGPRNRQQVGRRLLLRQDDNEQRLGGRVNQLPRQDQVLQLPGVLVRQNIEPQEVAAQQRVVLGEVKVAPGGEIRQTVDQEIPTVAERAQPLLIVQHLAHHRIPIKLALPMKKAAVTLGVLQIFQRRPSRLVSLAGIFFRRRTALGQIQ